MYLIDRIFYLFFSYYLLVIFMGEASFGTQEVKMVDRSNISITGVNKIVNEEVNK